MSTNFSTVLSQLRKDKGISQRNASQEFNISQALLSHYENGLREPGIDFILHACEYYGVSADYLLGRVSKTKSPLNIEIEGVLAELPQSQMTALADIILVLQNLKKLNDNEISNCVTHVLMDFSLLANENLLGAKDSTDEDNDIYYQTDMHLMFRKIKRLLAEKGMDTSEFESACRKASPLLYKEYDKTVDAINKTIEKLK